jgi:hypothetical protein
LPTAQASVLVRALTALNWLENATFNGDGFTVGVITHAGAAKAGLARTMAAPMAGRDHGSPAGHAAGPAPGRTSVE